MSKVNSSLVQSVKKLLKYFEIEVISFDELLKTETFPEDLVQGLYNLKSFYCDEFNYIAINEFNLNEATELVLKELVNIETNKISTNSLEDRQDLDTNELASEMGVLKIISALNINPAPYINRVFEVLKEYNKADVDKAELYSTKVCDRILGSYVFNMSA